MSFVLCVRFAEPEAKVPVTVRLYVLAGVPPVPPLLPPPPHPVVPTTITARKANAHRPPDFHMPGLRLQAPRSIRPGKPQSER